jgi:hypothetical protein
MVPSRAKMTTFTLEVPRSMPRRERMRRFGGLEFGVRDRSSL